MLKTATLTLGLALTGVAQAQETEYPMIMALDVPCWPTQAIANDLAVSFGETLALGSPITTVEHTNGTTYPGILMLTATSDWSKHTILVAFPDGMSCVLAQGGELLTPGQINQIAR